MKRMSVLAMLVAALAAASASASVVIGNFEGAALSDNAAWGNWSTGPGNLSSFPKYSLTTADPTLGSQSLLITNAGYQQNLAFWGGTAGQPGSLADFAANSKILVDVTYPASSVGGGYAQIYEIAFNSSGGGYEGRNYSGQGVGFGPSGAGVQKQTLVFDYSNHKAAWGGSASSYAQIIFSTNSDASHGFFQFDNVRLVPEPATASLVGLAAVAGLAVRRRR